MEIKDDFDLLLKDVKEYVDTSRQLIRLQLIESVSKIVAILVSVCIVLLVVSIGFMFISVALAHVFASLWHHVFAGYLTVAFIYIITGLILTKYASALLIKPIMNRIIQQIFGNE